MVECTGLIAAVSLLVCIFSAKKSEYLFNLAAGMLIVCVFVWILFWYFGPIADIPLHAYERDEIHQAGYEVRE